TFVRKAKIPETERTKEEKAEAGENAAVVVWNALDGRSIDAENMDPLLRELSELSCQEFLQPDPDSTATTVALSVSLKGNKEYKLQLEREQNGETTRYTGTSSLVSQPFEMPAYTAEELIRKAEALFKTEKAGDSTRDG
ncbi:MAG: hypothetical protein JXA62_09120, partial [Candidatus Aminicenantes bacterium]|nr:hypothetical protein [Candidatus Aminicenantes bacterium]